MGRRAEVAAQGDHETLIARVRWLWENRRELPFDVEPGPAGQWYFADWLADAKTRRMSWGARGGHMDTICYAWGEHPPCSCPGSPEDLEDLFHGLEESDRRAILRSWVVENGRIWQPGLCKTYLAQIEGRQASLRGACAKHGKTKELQILESVAVVLSTPPPYADLAAPTCPPPAPHVPPTCEGGALQSSSSSSTSETEERDPSDLVGDPDGSADDTPDPPADPKRKAARNGNVEEMRWRIEETWAAHLGMREYYWQDVEFTDKPPGSPPTLTPQRRKLIGEALKRHDKGLLGPGDRERWKLTSKTRAAGIGIFLDPWCTARAEGNVLAEGGKRYLEPERAWKIKSGVDQVERFAELYFARKERKRGAS